MSITSVMKRCPLMTHVAHALSWEPHTLGPEDVESRAWVPTVAAPPWSSEALLSTERMEERQRGPAALRPPCDKDFYKGSSEDEPRLSVSGLPGGGHLPKSADYHDLPGGPVAKTSSSQCGGAGNGGTGSTPGWGTKIPTCLRVWPK